MSKTKKIEKGFQYLLNKTKIITDQICLIIGAYTPGMMTDVVREVKDAARVREDALLNRVKAMVEERQWSMNESNLRMMRDIEELKVILFQLKYNTK